MKPHITLLLSLLLPATFCYSQTIKYLDISGGASFPTGDFGDKNIRSDRSGIANAGQTVSISYNHLLNRKFGFSIKAMGNRNPLDISSFEQSLATTPLGIYVFRSNGPVAPPPPPPPPPPGTYKYYPNWKGEKHAWLSSALLAGGYSEFLLRPGLSFTGKILAGAVYIKSPEINIESVGDTAAAYLVQSSESAIGLGYSFSVGLKHSFSKKLSLLFNAEYFGTTRATFKDIVTTLTTTQGRQGSLHFQMQQMRTIANGKQALSMVNINLGLGLNL